MSYTNLVLNERETIELLHEQGFSQKEIAMELNRDPSTICRELKRNAYYNNRYRAHKAQGDSKRRKCGQQKRPVLENPLIISKVTNSLEKGLAPHVISCRLRLEKSPIQISTESIYSLIYKDYLNGGELWKRSLYKRKRRKHSLRRPDNRGKIPNQMWIEQRPSSVDNRTRYGHWEGDTVVGANHKGVIATLIERKSRYMEASKVESKHSEIVIGKIITQLSKFPLEYIKTLTVDGGLEFAKHEQITKRLGTQVYFTRPGRPYEKGSIENGNKILRRYFPKGMDLRKISGQMVRRVIEQINNTPRKILGYLTPYEVLFNNRKIALQI